MVCSAITPEARAGVEPVGCQNILSEGIPCLGDIVPLIAARRQPRAIFFYWDIPMRMPLVSYIAALPVLRILLLPHRQVLFPAVLLSQNHES